LSVWQTHDDEDGVSVLSHEMSASRTSKAWWSRQNAVLGRSHYRTDATGEPGVLNSSNSVTGGDGNEGRQIFSLLGLANKVYEIY